MNKYEYTFNDKRVLLDVMVILFNVLVQIVEPFTAHYVFALGVARFLSCAHWVLQV